MVAHGFVKEIPHAYPIYKHKYMEDFSKINQKLNRIALYIDSRSKDCKITKTELFAVRKKICRASPQPAKYDIWNKSGEGYVEDQKG